MNHTTQLTENSCQNLAVLFSFGNNSKECEALTNKFVSTNDLEEKESIINRIISDATKQNTVDSDKVFLAGLKVLISIANMKTETLIRVIKENNIKIDLTDI